MSALTPGPIDGRWQLLRAELDGEDAPDLVLKKTEVILAYGAYEVRFGGEIADRGIFKLGNALNEKTMVLQGVEGPNAGRVIPCIYQHVGERLRVCYGLDGVMPFAFATEPGQQRYLATYSRVPRWCSLL